MFGDICGLDKVRVFFEFRYDYGAVFVLCYFGYRMVLFDVGVLGNCLCLVGDCLVSF